MGEQAFREYYRHLSDEQLGQILADKQDLVPEAVNALKEEAQSRNVALPEPTRWTQQADSDERVESLEDYDQYRRLVEQRRFVRRYVYIIAMAPFVLGLIFGKARFENSMVFIVLTLGWAMCFAAWGIVVNARFLAFKCPQCMNRFGSRQECFSCGFPRSAKQEPQHAIPGE
jgi:hypothetical protein